MLLINCYLFIDKRERERKLILQFVKFCLVYSSSFAEMGLAIDEKIKTSEIETSNNYDELQLSPAYQVLVSCIWMSLKVHII